MRRLIYVLVVLGVLGGAFLLTGWLMQNGPVAEKSEAEVKLVTVEVAELTEEAVELRLEAEGLVSARRETVLSAEVGGRVVSVSERFEAGGMFSEGEVVLELEKTDYEAAVANAESGLAEAELALETEVARGAQARRDWERLGRGGEPSEMVLRVPHIAAARARVGAAEAALLRARRDLERTVLRAPYGCRVRSAGVDVGAVVAPGARLGEVFEEETCEARLPFSLTEAAFLREGGEVELSAEVGGERLTWPGRIGRREGEVNRATMSLYLYAEAGVNESAPEGFKRPPPGLFVRAVVPGKVLEGVVAVPRAALRGEKAFWVIDEESRLRRREAEIVWRDGERLFVRDGLRAGERVCLTKVERAVEGMEVKVAGMKTEE
ncbi:MAG: efflux RND transporter periplasmic adaptor subunit [Verrucomicrobiales bacterium]